VNEGQFTQQCFWVS